MIFRVTHVTTYRYESEITTAHNQARLAPRRHGGQVCRAFDLHITPAPDDVHHYPDYFGNRIDHFSIHAPHRELVVEARSEVETLEPATPPPTDAGPWEDAVRALRTSHDAGDLHARQFAVDSPLVSTGPALEAFAASSFTPGRPLVGALLELNHRIATDFRYEPGTTTTSTPIEDVLEERRGVCQDFAHVFIGCLRTLGLPARYVSGYLETDPPPGTEKLVGSDASHAWVSAYVPGWGWLDLDPTNEAIPADRHVTTAWGRDYADVAPVKGVVFSGGGGHQLDVAVDVTRVDA